MKKITCLIFTILFVLSVSAQSFSEKVFQCEYNGSKSSPPNLFITFDYPNSNLTIKGSEEGSTLKLKYKDLIRDSKKIVYVYTSVDPYGTEILVAIYDYASINTKLVYFKYPNGDEVNYWMCK